MRTRRDFEAQMRAQIHRAIAAGRSAGPRGDISDVAEVITICVTALAEEYAKELAAARNDAGTT